MSEAYEIRVCMDIGSQSHQVAIGLSTGKILEEFNISHTPQDIDLFFNKIENHKVNDQLPVVVAMESYNGHARPIDKYVLEKGYRLINVNNYKLAQFKKIFPGASKRDVIDTRKMFELFTLQDHLPLAKNALQPVIPIPEVNEKLKRITRRRRSLVNEKVRVVNRMQSDLQAISPGLLGITGSADNLWFLRFLTSRNEIQQLSRIQFKSLLKIKGLGNSYALEIKNWQENAIFSADAEWVGEMIIRDARRLLELIDAISALEKKIDLLATESEMAKRLKTIGGFGKICAAELAGEIGTTDRFDSEASLALYLGMAILNNSSGLYEGTKKSKHVNYSAKAAMMTATAIHIRSSSQSKKYYDKKRNEGKKHNQAVRSLGRHMVRVIWSMLKNERDFIMQNND
ncbi:MAG: IS110 family transposase [Gammaproteobacteria bacterium]|nr:IS110 family transposase [Gammaproteobacteria bacterium]